MRLSRRVDSTVMADGETEIDSIIDYDEHGRERRVTHEQTFDHRDKWTYEYDAAGRALSAHDDLGYRET